MRTNISPRGSLLPTLTTTKDKTTRAAAWLLLAPLMGCTVANAGETATESEDVGQVSAAVTSVPTGVNCLRVVVGSTAKNFSLSAGTSSAQLSLGALPAGPATVTADGYSVACPAGNDAPIEESTWVSDPFAVDIRAGLVNSIPIVLRAKPTGSASVDFRASAASIALGGYSSYAVLSDGTVRLWGTDWTAVAGSPGTPTKPRAIPGLTGVASIAAGEMFACALFQTTGSVACWGHNNYGQLGNGTTTQSSVPVLVPGLSGVTAITAGYTHVCALMSDRKVKCWGRGDQGQLGVAGSSLSPIEVFTDATSVSAGGDHTCIVTRERAITCAGRNLNGQLGLGHTTAVSGWNAIPSSNGTEQVFGGAFSTCRVRGDGATSCWGYNGFGQLGIGSTTTTPTPTNVPGLLGATSIAMGQSHLCAVVGGSVMCAGGGYYLGDGAAINSSVPVRALGLTNVVEVKAGNYHSCARRDTGDVYCWGRNDTGQLGDGSYTYQYKPVLVGL